MKSHYFSRWLDLGCLCVAALFLGIPLLSAAEPPPPIEWQAGFGGSDLDNCFSVLATSDGGSLLGGNSGSGISGNKSAPSYGGLDFWIVKVDASGNKLWDRAFGGSATDFLLSMAATTNGGFLALGYSNSGASGNKTTASHGDFDFWLVKVDAAGNKIWDRSFGGSDRDLPTTVVSTGDGNFLLGGISRSSPSGNKTSPNIGDFDVWLVKVDADGNKLWDKSFGGTGQETPFSASDAFIVIVPSGDGGYLMGAPSASGASGNKSSPNYGDVDYWLVKLDADGNKLWDKSFGGNLNDVVRGVAPATDGGFLLAGMSWSGISGNKSAPAFGLTDTWIVKVDADGNKLWDKTIGGKGEDFNDGVVSLGGAGFALGGGNPFDYWLVTVDVRGNKTSDQTYGGTGVEELGAFVPGIDGTLLLTGVSWSGVSGNKTSPNYGAGDYWAIRVGPLEGLCTNCPPRFTLQPTNHLVLPGTNVTLVAGAVGAKRSYQWRFEGTPITGATNSTYSITNVSLTNGHGNYSVVVSNEFGSITSSNALVFVRIRPVIIAQPVTQIITEGQDAIYTCVATGAPPIFYRWSGAGITPFTNTTGILVYSNAVVSITNGVRCHVINAAGNVLSASASLILRPDFDRDGMADWWEAQFGFNTNNAADAGLDHDDDGISNRDEYASATDPMDAASGLKLAIQSDGDGDSVLLQFTAQSNLTYAVEYRSGNAAATWQILSNVMPAGTARTLGIFDHTAPADGKLYRVRTPLEPNR